MPAGDREVAALPRPRAAARRARAQRRGGGGRPVTALERDLARLRDELTWPPTPDLATAVAERIAAEPRRAPRWRGLGPLRPATAAIVALVAALAVAATLAAAPGVRARIAHWLGIGAVRI